jgi:hypothetical protein
MSGKRTYHERTGEGFEDSYLLRPQDGKMCCLGFFGLACGLPPERITNVGTPENIPRDRPYQTPVQVWSAFQKVGEGLFRDCDPGYTLSHTCKELMKTNDEVDLTPQEREEEISRLFAAIGVEVSFIDGGTT